MFRFYGVICLAAFYGCDSGAESAHRQDILISKLDSLQMAVDRLKSELDSSKQAELPATQPSAEAEKSNEKTQQTITVQKEKSKEKPVPETKQTIVTNETQLHYYQGMPKRLSARIGAWDGDNKRKIEFLDPYRKVTYTIEDVLRSYSSVSHLESFHPNGAVSQIDISLNPGASLNWYESTITFDINNQPLWKVDRTMPYSAVEDAMGKKWYWSKGNWVRQEIVLEQPVPGN